MTRRFVFCVAHRSIRAYIWKRRTNEGCNLRTTAHVVRKVPPRLHAQQREMCITTYSQRSPSHLTRSRRRTLSCRLLRWLVGPVVATNPCRLLTCKNVSTGLVAVVALLKGSTNRFKSTGATGEPSPCWVTRTSAARKARVPHPPPLPRKQRNNKSLARHLNFRTQHIFDIIS